MRQVVHLLRRRFAFMHVDRFGYTSNRGSLAIVLCLLADVEVRYARWRRSEPTMSRPRHYPCSERPIPSRPPLVYDALSGSFAAFAGRTSMTVTSRGLYAYLTILTGNRAGTNFPLDARRKTLIGRGTDCHISLPDPLCSRVHATLSCTPDGWVIRDAESRNGTLVNGQKIDEAMVVDGNTIRVGSAEFEFHESEEPPTAKGDDPQLMQTIVQDMPIAVQESHEEALAGLPSTEQVKELMLLYQLCIKLLGCGDPNRVLEIALDLLRKRTAASVVGFLSVNDEGGLQPKIGDPARRGQPRDAQSIAHRARVAARARRVGGQSGVEGRDARPGPFCRCRLCAAWCAATRTASEPRSARSTSISKTAAFANRISTSSSPWPTSWPSRSCGPAR